MGAGQHAHELVCIIDDDAGVRDSTRALVESHGYATNNFESAHDFLSSPAIERASCLVLDMQMPGMSGLELIEELRGRGIKTPALIMTASGNKFTARISRAGGTAILYKPVNGEELIRWLKTTLERQA